MHCETWFQTDWMMSKALLMVFEEQSGILALQLLHLFDKAKAIAKNRDSLLRPSQVLSQFFKKATFAVSAPAFDTAVLCFSACQIWVFFTAELLLHWFPFIII